jgi:hypothetical protein
VGRQATYATSTSTEREPTEPKTGWMDRRRERKRLKQERTGDSPEKLAERHTPGETAVDRMLRLGGLERESRFKDR